MIKTIMKRGGDLLDEEIKNIIFEYYNDNHIGENLSTFIVKKLNFKEVCRQCSRRIFTDAYMKGKRKNDKS